MYFPQSQVTPNLHTNGGEFQIASTGEAYKGYYFTVSTGQKFTGRNQNDNPVLELTAAVIETNNTFNVQLPEVTTLRNIEYDDFECGHIKSVYFKGETMLSNLEPICYNCNNNMGVQNLIDYKNELLNEMG